MSHSFFSLPSLLPSSLFSHCCCTHKLTCGWTDSRAQQGSRVSGVWLTDQWWAPRERVKGEGQRSGSGECENGAGKAGVLGNKVMLPKASISSILNVDEYLVTKFLWVYRVIYTSWYWFILAPAFGIGSKAHEFAVQMVNAVLCCLESGALLHRLSTREHWQVLFWNFVKYATWQIFVSWSQVFNYQI